MSGIIGAGAITKSGVLGTFPEWHIIQYVPGSIGASTSSTTSDTYQVSSVTNTITFTAGNYIYAHGVVNIFRHGGGANVGCRGQLSTDDSAGATGNFGNYAVHFQEVSGQNPQGRTSQPLFGRIQPAGTSVTVRIKWRAENGGTSILYNENCLIDLWEVQA